MAEKNALGSFYEILTRGSRRARSGETQLLQVNHGNRENLLTKLVKGVKREGAVILEAAAGNFRQDEHKT
jgi:hypothetical protein